MTTLPALRGIDPRHIEHLGGDGIAGEVMSKTVPVEVCREIVARGLIVIGHPIGTAEGAAQARKLVGAYPREPHDPQAYTAGIVSILAEQPIDIVREAIDRLTRRLKFLPTRADLTEIIEEILSTRHLVLARAKAIVDAAERRDAERKDEQRRDDERRRFHEVLGEAWDAWWEIPLGRRYNGTVADFAAGWKAAGDKAAFCESWGSTARIEEGTAA